VTEPLSLPAFCYRAGNGTPGRRRGFQTFLVGVVVSQYTAGPVRLATGWRRLESVRVVFQYAGDGVEICSPGDAVVLESNGAGVFAAARITALQSMREFNQAGLSVNALCAYDVVAVAGKCHGKDDSNNGDDHHQLHQGDASLKVLVYISHR